MSCNKNYQKAFDKKLTKRFTKTYKFDNHGINKFTLLLRKGAYSYMDGLEKFNKRSLPEKKDYCNPFNMENIILLIQITSTQKECVKNLK